MAARWLQVRAIAYVVAARMLLSRRGMPATLRALARRRAGRAVDVEDALHAVRRAGRLAGATCLPQAVALTALLRRDGADPTVVLGCRRYDNGHWGAHAWVELDGVVWDPLPSGAHATLARCDAARDWVPAAAGERPGSSR